VTSTSLTGRRAPTADKSDVDDLLANGCSFSLLIFFVCCLVLKFSTLTELQGVRDLLSPMEERHYVVPTHVLSALLFACVVGALAVTTMVVVVQIAHARVLQRREAAKQKLPACDWHLPVGQSYVCFLSHYKVEAGAEARYIKDALDQMLGHPTYLDSSSEQALTLSAVPASPLASCYEALEAPFGVCRFAYGTDLADLQVLFERGVHVSEVLVLLLSEGLLTRPWVRTRIGIEPRTGHTAALARRVCS
jgi:hypothetical protein